MTVFTVLATGALCILCFFLGARVGQAAKNGEVLRPPEGNPFRAFRERESRREAEREQRRLDIILRNVERFDGTGQGQEDVPEGRG